MNDVIFAYARRLEISTNLWRKIGHNSQVFYDKGTGILVIRQKADLYVITPYDMSKSHKAKIAYKETIFALTIQKSHKLIAFQTSYNSLNVRNFQNEKEATITLNKTDMTQSVLQFEFIYTSTQPIDLMVIENFGIHFYKIDEEKMACREVKFISSAISVCWFEPKYEVLVSTNFKDPGVIQTYFVSDAKSNYNKFKGPPIKLDISTDASQNKEGLMGFINKSLPFMGGNASNKLFKVFPDLRHKDLMQRNQNESDPSFQMHKILLTSIYKKSYLIHLNSFLGKVFIYHLTNEKVQMITPIISVPSDGTYSMCVVDNLLVIHNHSDIISMIYDIKRYHIYFPIGYPSPMPVLKEKDALNKKKSLLMKPSGPATIIQSQSITFSKDEGQDNPRRSIYFPSNSLSNSALTTNSNTGSLVVRESSSILSSGVNTHSVLSVESSGSVVSKDIMFPDTPKRSLKQSLTRPMQEDQFIFDFSCKLNLDFQRLGDETHREKEDFCVKANISLEQNVVPNFLSETAMDPPQENIVYESPAEIYESTTKFLEDEYIINTKDCCFYRIGIDNEAIPLLVEDKIDTFFIIIRRTKSKSIALEFLSNLIKAKTELMVLSYIFRNISEIYREAFKENPQEKANPALKYRSDSLITEQSSLRETKIRNGYTIILQGDILQNVFLPIVENEEVDKGYMINCLLQYIRESLDCDIYLSPSIYIILIKLILQEKRFVFLHSLLQYHVIPDSTELAHLLIDLDSDQLSVGRDKMKFDKEKDDRYQGTFQIGLDMLFRLKKFYDLFEILIQKGKIFEALSLVKKYTLKNIKLTSVVSGAAKSKSKLSNKMIIEFFTEMEMTHANSGGKKGKAKKSHTNMFAFGLEELRLALEKVL